MEKLTLLYQMNGIPVEDIEEKIFVSEDHSPVIGQQIDNYYRFIFYGEVKEKEAKEFIESRIQELTFIEE